MPKLLRTTTGKIVRNSRLDGSRLLQSFLCTYRAEGYNFNHRSLNRLHLEEIVFKANVCQGDLGLAQSLIARANCRLDSQQKNHMGSNQHSLGNLGGVGLGRTLDLCDLVLRGDALATPIDRPGTQASGCRTDATKSEIYYVCDPCVLLRSSSNLDLLRCYLWTQKK